MVKTEVVQKGRGYPYHFLATQQKVNIKIFLVKSVKESRDWYILVPNDKRIIHIT